MFLEYKLNNNIKIKNYIINSLIITYEQFIFDYVHIDLRTITIKLFINYNIKKWKNLLFIIFYL